MWKKIQSVYGIPVLRRCFFFRCTFCGIQFLAACPESSHGDWGVECVCGVIDPVRQAPSVFFSLQVFFWEGGFLRHRNILGSRCVPQVFLADVGILRCWQSFCRSPHLEAEQTRQAVVAQATAGYGARIWATESQIFGTSAGNVNPASPKPYDSDICFLSIWYRGKWKKHEKAGRIMSAQRPPFWFCCLLLLKL